LSKVLQEHELPVPGLQGNPLLVSEQHADILGRECGGGETWLNRACGDGRGLRRGRNRRYDRISRSRFLSGRTNVQRPSINAQPEITDCTLKYCTPYKISGHAIWRSDNQRADQILG
jgi:hypothetical protein